MADARPLGPDELAQIDKSIQATDTQTVQAILMMAAAELANRAREPHTHSVMGKVEQTSTEICVAFACGQSSRILSAAYLQLRQRLCQIAAGETE